MPKPFSPTDSALVLIDHQYGTMQLIKNLRVEDVKRNTLALARAAQILDMPGRDHEQPGRPAAGADASRAGAVPAEGLRRARQKARRRQCVDDPAFKSAVEGLGRRNLIMAGVTTDVCLVYPAITGIELGYRCRRCSTHRDRRSSCRRKRHGCACTMRRRADRHQHDDRRAGARLEPARRDGSAGAAVHQGAAADPAGRMSGRIGGRSAGHRPHGTAPRTLSSAR